MAAADIPAARVCTKCGDSKPATTEFFNRHLRGKHGLKAWCRVCTTAVRRLQKTGVKVGRAEVWPEGFKRCSACSVLKRATEQFFFAHHQGRLGLNARCKTCFLERCKSRWDKRHPQGPSRRMVPWTAAEKKRCPRCGIVKQATTDNFGFRREGAGLGYYCRPCNRDYRKSLPQRPETNAARVANRRARKKGADGSYSSADVRSALVAQQSRCWWCQKKITKYHVDHRIPLARGGSNGPENIVISCPSCNLRKGASMPWELENPRLL